jgi:hypothetical protein
MSDSGLAFGQECDARDDDLIAGDQARDHRDATCGQHAIAELDGAACDMALGRVQNEDAARAPLDSREQCRCWYRNGRCRRAWQLDRDHTAAA